MVKKARLVISTALTTSNKINKNTKNENKKNIK